MLLLDYDGMTGLMATTTTNDIGVDNDKQYIYKQSDTKLNAQQKIMLIFRRFKEKNGRDFEQ